MIYANDTNKSKAVFENLSPALLFANNQVLEKTFIYIDIQVVHCHFHNEANCKHGRVENDQQILPQAKKAVRMDFNLQNCFETQLVC